MKSLIAITAAATAFITISPSFAQSPNPADQALQGFRSLLGNPPADSAEQDLNDQERRLNDLIERSTQEGRIDHHQADQAFDELRSIHGQKDDMRARHNGRLSPQDHDYLRDRLAALDRRIDEMRANSPRAFGPPDQPPPPRYDEGNRGRFWDGAPPSFHQREDWLEQRIRDGIADGSLDRNEAGRALEQLRSIRNSEADYLRRDRGDLNDADRAQLSARLDDLARDLHWDRRR